MYASAIGGVNSRNTSFGARGGGSSWNDRSVGRCRSIEARTEAGEETWAAALAANGTERPFGGWARARRAFRDAA